MGRNEDRLRELESKIQALESEINRLRVQAVEERMVELSDRVIKEKAEEWKERFTEELAKAVEKGKGDEKYEPKSFMYDPFYMMETLGYKERVMSVSYDTLRLMSERNPIIAAIINTRIHQVTSFARPPRSRYDLGFEIVLRDSKKTPTKEEEKKILELTKMIESTGLPTVVDEESRDTFGMFLAKQVRDSLVFDQACFEIVSGRNGKPVAFYAVDSSTIRLATTPRMLRSWYETTNKELKKLMDNKDFEKVKYVQVVGGKVVNTYTEKEMAFCIRNPRSWLQSNGYGVSELELLITTITAHFYAEEYNRRFFSTGSAPKGIIHFEGGSAGITQAQLDAFRRQWHAQVMGVWNAWRTPIIASPAKLVYTNLQMTNRQMEFSNWIEYLIKLICAIYLIDPAEINFDLRGGAMQQAPMFESSSEAKLKMSRDRGLRPLLKFFEEEIDKNIIFQIDDKFELQFVGLDLRSEKEMQDLKIRELERFKTIDEIRAEYDLDPLGEDKGGDLIMDSSYITYINQRRLEKMQMGGIGGMMGGFGGGFGEEEEKKEEMDRRFDFGEEEIEEESEESEEGEK